MHLNPKTALLSAAIINTLFGVYSVAVVALALGRCRRQGACIEGPWYSLLLLAAPYFLAAIVSLVFWAYLRRSDRLGRHHWFAWPVAIVLVVLPFLPFVQLQSPAERQEFAEKQRRLQNQVQAILPNREEYDRYWRDVVLTVSGCRSCDMTVEFNGATHVFRRDATSHDNWQPEGVGYRCFRFFGSFYRDDVRRLLSQQDPDTVSYRPPPFEDLRPGQEPYLGKLDFDRLDSCLRLTPTGPTGEPSGASVP